MFRWLLLAPLLILARGAAAAPDEAILGKDEGYPVAPRMALMHQPRYIVGSFSSIDSFGPHCMLAPAADPRPLPSAAKETAFSYRYDGAEYTLDDYLQHQRATAVLVLKDGHIETERYDYGRTKEMRMLSNSMAKTLLALAIGEALQDGSIRSLDDTADHYVPALAGTLYGQTRLVNLLRMASGARFSEDYTSHDDRAVFNTVARRMGIAEAARTVTEREAPQGERFNYATSQSEILGLVLRAATRRDACSYIDDKIWKPMGAESPASYLLNPIDGVELVGGSFSATARDYARLGEMLADNGQVRGHQLVPRQFLLDMTDPARQPLAFRPGTMDSHGSHYYGYGYQVWLMPGDHRSFVLLGVYGQAIFVDPVLNLVMVHLGVGAEARGDASGAHLGRERDALWRGIVSHYSASPTANVAATAPVQR